MYEFESTTFPNFTISQLTKLKKEHFRIKKKQTLQNICNVYKGHYFEPKVKSICDANSSKVNVNYLFHVLKEDLTSCSSIDFVSCCSSTQHSE